MAGPWERYAPQTDAGPWDAYRAPAANAENPEISEVPERTLPQELARQGGLTVRAGAKGVAGLPLMAGDFINRVLNLLPGVNLKMPSEVVDRGLTAAGLPVPETGTERIAGMGAEAIAGGVPAVAAGRALAGAASPVTSAVGASLAASPGTQAVSGAVGGMVGGATAEAGADPMVQLVAALVSGTITPLAFASAVESTKAAARGVSKLAKPFTQGGREEVVGNAMRRMSTSPDETLANLEKVPTYVEGSQPTTAQAGRDIGLLQAERALASQPGGVQFAVRKSENNAARNRQLDRVSGTPKDLEKAQADRAKEARELYGPALEETPVATPEVREAIAELSKRPSFREAMGRAVKLAEDEGHVIPRAKDGAKRAGPARDLDTDADDLVVAIRKLGGINSADPNVGGDEMRALGFAMDPRGPVFTRQQFGGESNRTNTTSGHALEEMARKLYDKGYLDEPDPISLMDKLSESSTGVGQTFSRFRTPPNADPLAQAIEALTKQMATKGKESNPIDLAGVGGVKIAHYTKLALDDMIDQAQARNQGNEVRVLSGIKSKLLGLVESDDYSPGYNKARLAFKEASAPVNQMETLQGIQGRTRLPGPDVTGEPVLSQAKWSTHVTKKIDDLADTLTADQVKTLRRIGKDLDRASLSENVGRAAGSNTFQNLSTANVIGAALGRGGAENAVVRTMAKPLDWLYKFPEAQIQDMLVKAMLDPVAGRIMLSKADKKNVEWIGQRLQKIATDAGYRMGGISSGAATQQSREQEESRE